VLYLGCLTAASSYGLTLLLPAFVDAAGGSQARAGLIYWCGALGAAGALAMTGRLTGRISAGWSAAAGSGLYAVAAGLLACGGLSGSVYPAGVLLGAGWALFFTSAPIAAASIAGPARAPSCFLVLAGFNALGIGAGPIAGQLLVSHGLSYRALFGLAMLLSLGSAALLSRLGRLEHTGITPARGATATGGVIGPLRLVLASRARPFLVMVGLGACVFTTMTADQAPFAASRGLNPSVFYACYTLGVIIPRFTVTGVLAKARPATATTALLAGMCIALAGFLLAGHDPVLYAASSVLLGVTYGLAYPLIQVQAADSAPAGLRQQALWSFGLAYFAGLYGFPLIAGAVIVAAGFQALIAVLVAAAALELAVSIRTRHAPARPRFQAGQVSITAAVVRIRGRSGKLPLKPTSENRAGQKARRTRERKTHA
jgi:MFS family permease